MDEYMKKTIKEYQALETLTDNNLISAHVVTEGKLKLLYDIIGHFSLYLDVKEVKPHE